MPKKQYTKKKVKITLQELHQPPPLGPNRYYYLAECISNCRTRECTKYCESRNIPYGGQKEFYVVNWNGDIVAKWAERYFFDNTPNTFEAVWRNPKPAYTQYHRYTSVPDIPLGGWCEYHPEGEERVNKYRLEYLAYTKKVEEERRRLVREASSSFSSTTAAKGKGKARD